MLDALRIIDFFYAPDDPAREILLRHSYQVEKKALAIAAGFPQVNREIISCGALLHDIGIRFCAAPDIGCYGEDDYLLHGILGAESLRAMKLPDGEIFARICERHTGSGISAEEIRERKLPLPERDFFPETPEEKIICLADKFYSKSGEMREKTVAEIRKSMAKFGPGPLARFEELYIGLKYSRFEQGENK